MDAATRTIQGRKDRRMNDTISRQAAIEALIELYEYQRDIDPTEAADLVRQGICLAEKKIEQLPSAQPEPSQVARDIATIIENEQDMRVIARNDIVRCKDCKHNPKDEWFGCPMSHLNEKQRPETAWCWKGERRTDGIR